MFGFILMFVLFVEKEQPNLYKHIINLFNKYSSTALYIIVTTKYHNIPVPLHEHVCH